MHAANFTYLSPPLAYHQAFEGWAIKVMQDVQITQEYTPSNLGSDPYNYIFALAQQSRPRKKRICSIKNETAYACPLCAYSHSVRRCYSGNSRRSSGWRRYYGAVPD